MFQVRIHGRGGQGVVTAAELLSVAAFLEGKHAQAFPSFGSERMGAPVVAFCRISGTEIRLREPIQTPDALIVQDATLFKAIDVLDGLKPDGFLLVNTSRSLGDIHVGNLFSRVRPDHAFTIPATELALAHIRRPAPNTALLGAFAALAGIVKLDSILEAIRQAFPGKMGEANVQAATAAHALIASTAARQEVSHA